METESERDGRTRIKLPLRSELYYEFDNSRSLDYSQHSLNVTAKKGALKIKTDGKRHCFRSLMLLFSAALAAIAVVVAARRMLWQANFVPRSYQVIRNLTMSQKRIKNRIHSAHRSVSITLKKCITLNAISSHLKVNFMKGGHS